MAEPFKRAAVEISKPQEAVGLISDGHREDGARRLIFSLRLILPLRLEDKK
jgi:hypothetical protein